MDKKVQIVDGKIRMPCPHCHQQMTVVVPQSFGINGAPGLMIDKQTNTLELVKDGKA